MLLRYITVHDAFQSFNGIVVIVLQYLLSDLDEQKEDDKNKQVAKNADSSYDDVDDL